MGGGDGFDVFGEGGSGFGKGEMLQNIQKLGGCEAFLEGEINAGHAVSLGVKEPLARKRHDQLLPCQRPLGAWGFGSTDAFIVLLDLRPARAQLFLVIRGAHHLHLVGIRLDVTLVAFTLGGWLR